MSGHLVQVTLGDSQIKIHAHTIQFLLPVLDLLRFLEMTTVYWEIFASLNFRENDNFNNFTKIFSRMIHMGTIKGVAWPYFTKFNFATEQIYSRNL